MMAAVPSCLVEALSGLLLVLYLNPEPQVVSGLIA